jgi:hypothetical protein
MFEQSLGLMMRQLSAFVPDYFILGRALLRMVIIVMYTYLARKGHTLSYRYR